MVLGSLVNLLRLLNPSSDSIKICYQTTYNATWSNDKKNEAKKKKALTSNDEFPRLAKGTGLAFATASRHFLGLEVGNLTGP